MASYTDTLKPITSKRRAPFQQIARTIAGDDDYSIYAGDWWEIPCCWEMLQARLQLTTDASVANRTVRVRQVTGVATICEFIADAVAASTAVTHLYFPAGTESGTMSAAWLGLNPLGVTIFGETERILITVDNGVAGDVLVCRFNFRWLNWELGMDIPYALQQAQDKYPGYRFA